MSEPLFPLGQVVMTPEAMTAFESSGDDPLDFLFRHVNGDWGDVDEHDRHENELSLRHGWRILSCYRLNTGAKVWCLTEADRSVTTFLLPDEY